ncbi:neuronal acetylcholine receptor subunit alpha-2-like [Babylonia areolata]|uniref:neuronal acetylcholine receptor subunit alpha-2-like n=1 Tax=Babylonia areolata TaxID=304850 RepID=UPI003FCFE0DC
MAYYHWRNWLLNHKTVLQKVPPMPMDLSGNFVRLKVDVGFYSISVLNVDESQQTVTMSGGFQFQWNHGSLALTEELIEDFTGGNSTLLSSYVSVPSQLLWLPHVAMVEGVSSVDILRDVYAEASIYANGNISVFHTSVFTFTCQLSMTHYPFDSHPCPITIVDTSNMTEMLPFYIDYNEAFGVEGEWVITNVTANTVLHVNLQQTFPQFVIYLRRKTTYYSVMVVMPMVLTSYLNVLVFLLPLEVGDKASYLVTLTMSLSVFTSFFNTDMPRGLDSLPWIFHLLLFVYAEVFLILLTTLLILRRYQHEKQEDTCVSSSEGNSNRVSPTQTVFDENEGETCGSRKELKKEDERRPKMTAKTFIRKMTVARLEAISFVIAFTVNTVGLGVILSNLV